MEDRRLLHLRLKARPENLATVRKAVAGALVALDCDHRTCQLVVLAVNEACMNVMQHGYRGDPSGEMVLDIFNNGHELEFRLTDFAETADRALIHPRPLDEIRPGGLGTYFIQEIMDEFEYTVPSSGRGNLLIMKKQYGPSREV